MEIAIGIDLGTTFSVIGFFDQDGRCRTIPNSEGDLTTPSVVYFDADQPIVGKEAAKAGTFEPDRCAFLAKRDMGKNHYHREILDQSIPPEVIQAIVLKKLCEDARVQLGDVTKAVITVPAYFNEPRRKATQDAGRLAGLEVLDIINEPTAAAIAYGVQEGFLDKDGAAANRELILVYDLGGGTFDATLMEIKGASYRALATGGDVHLGGVDWDRRIADYAADEFRRQHGFDPRNDPSASLELSREAEDAKRALTARTVTTMHVAYSGKRMRLELTRDKLKELTDDLTSRTIFTCKKVLTDAKKTWSDVTRVLAVGGSSRMPLVQEALEVESGKTVDRSLAPDEAIAHGAAIYAQLKSNGRVEAIANLSVTNVSSHDLGVLGVERATGMPRRKVLIPRNSPLPARGAGRFVTRQDGQGDVAVKVIEGGDASGNHSTPIGRFLVENLPPGTKKGTPVIVSFTYQQDGRLDVSASVSGVEGSGTMSVERATGLGDAEVEMWRSRIERNQVVQQPDSPAPAASDAAATGAATVIDETITMDRPEIPAVDTGAPDPAAAMAAVDGPQASTDDLGDSGDFDALLDNDEADFLGEDLDADTAETQPGGIDPPQPEPVAESPTVAVQTPDSPTVAVNVDVPAKEAEEPAFDGPLFIEQPTVEESPVVETNAPVVDTSAPVVDTSAPVVDTSAPVVDTSAPVVDTSSPIVDTSAPAVDTSTPAVDTGAPLVDTSTPSVDTSNPVVDTGAPASEAETSVVEPVAESAASEASQAEFAPADGGDEAAKETAAPVFEGEAADPADVPSLQELGLEEAPKEDVALGNLDFLEAEESKQSADDDNDLQDFLGSLQ